MGLLEGMFYSESRVWMLPVMNLNGVAPNTLVVPTDNETPLQFNTDGQWDIYGASAVTTIPVAGGLPNLTPINFNMENQATNEKWFRNSKNRIVTAQPLEHFAGKTGTVGYTTWPRVQDKGSRLFPQVSHQAAATPTERSPLYVALHTILSRPGGSAGDSKIQLGSMTDSWQRYGGLYTWYSQATDAFSVANPLLPNGTATIQVPINGTQYFFVDSIYCRQDNAALGPVDAFNPLVQEQEILVQMQDTTSLDNWFKPNFAPLWAVAGSRAGFPYRPPTCFVVRPNGNIEITVKTGPTTTLENQLTFTFGGTLVDLPDDLMASALVAAGQAAPANG